MIFSAALIFKLDMKMTRSPYLTMLSKERGIVTDGKEHNKI